MYVRNILIHNFRNHRERLIELPDFLYISGDNGAGKTSIIESIYLILTLRPFKSQIQDLKTFDTDFLRIKAEFNDDYYNDLVYFYDSKRTVLINSDKNQDLKNYSFANPVICYSPNYETILSPNHPDRRNFVDRIIFYSDKSHMDNVRIYNQLLKRKRTELLSSRPDITVLEILTKQMAEVSDEISYKRESIINIINDLIKRDPDIYSLISGINLSIHKSLINPEKIIQEMQSGRVLSGSHKDLIYIKQNGKIIEKFQSYGQKKSCLLILLYYFMLYLQDERGGHITLLLDDFEAGLDHKREDILYNLFLNSQNKKQVIITGLNNKRISANTMHLL